MYTEESLREELIAKLEKEQKEYLDGLKEKGVDEVIKNVYEINARQEEKMNYTLTYRAGKLSVCRDGYKRNIRIERAFGQDE